MRKTSMRATRTLAAGAALVALAVGSADARVTGFDIVSTKPVFDGQSFGDAGAYERIDAIATFAVDPASLRVGGIVDIDRAPVNRAGEVEFSAEVSILQPAAEDGRSPVLFYEVPNRGRNLSFMLLNRGSSSAIPSTAEEAGDGFLMSRGYTLVWSGWQTDVADDLLNLSLPVLPDVTGPSREEFVFDEPGEVSTAKLTYPAADLDPAKATLTVRAREADERQTADGLGFRYLSPTEIEITRPASADAGAIYEFIYPAKDAVPTGLAFVATSDLVSFLRGNPGHDVQSPLSGIEHTIGMGISQSGRFLRDLIYQGFNADEQGARVFDGAMPHIAGSRKTFTNYRLAQPGRYSRQHEDHDYPGDQFPFTYAETTDPLTGKTESILSACSASDTCPKVMQTDTSTEFWQARASLLTTAPDGEPLEMPEGVRLYFMAGAPHFNSWSATSEETATCVYPSNPLHAGAGDASPAGRHGGLGDRRHRAAGQPLSEPGRRHAGHARGAEAAADRRRHAQPAAQSAPGHGLRHPAADRRRQLSGVAAGGRCRRHPAGRRRARLRAGAARHLLGLEPAQGGLRRGRAVQPDRQLRAVPEGGGGRRQPRASERALRRHGRLSRGDQGGR